MSADAPDDPVVVPLDGRSGLGQGTGGGEDDGTQACEVVGRDAAVDVCVQVQRRQCARPHGYSNSSSATPRLHRS